MASQVQIVLARIVDDFRFVSDAGRDLGRAPVMQRVDKPVSIMWKRRGSQADVDKAKQWAKASGEGWNVFTYPTAERDAMRRAKIDILHLQLPATP